MADKNKNLIIKKMADTEKQKVDKIANAIISYLEFFKNLQKLEKMKWF